MESSVWLIAGPTASGKSALALRLAEALGGEVVNADSMQLYAGLRVLTARPSPADEARTRHHLYGVADPAQAWSVGRWLSAMKPVLDALAQARRPAIVTGGTGLYFRALTVGLADIPAPAAQVREAAAALWDRLGEAGVRAALARRDPASAARIAPGDRQRLLRALSVLEATGRPLSEWQADTQPTLAATSYAAAVLEPPRPALYARCDLRLRSMAERGALGEVAALLARDLSPELPAMKALGVREFAAHLSGRCTLEEAIAEVQLQTRRYAKRQSTWFRNQTPQWPRIASPDEETQWAKLRRLVEAHA